MRKMILQDVLDIAQYERVRPQYRADVIAHKQTRRLEVGPMIWFSFETFETMLYQVQEMMRSERMVDERQIAREIDAFNELIPAKHQLSASMMIAILDERQRQNFLAQATTLPQHTFLQIDDQRLTFEFDARQNSPDRFNTLQFVTVNLSPDQVARFADSRVSIGFDHPLYTFEQELSAELKATLAQDLRRD